MGPELSHAVAGLGLTDVVLVYLVTVSIAVVCWLVASVWVFVLVRTSRRSALRRDFEHRLEAKQQIPSGAGMRMSFGYVALSLLGDNCVQATVLYRVSRWLGRRRLASLARAAQGLGRFVTHADISPDAEIGPGLYLYHGLGTVIGKGTRIGANAIVCQNVTIGGGAALGDDVRLWAGAVVVGRVTVGDRSEIGANGVVVSDVPADTIAVGVPATRFLPKTTADPAPPS
jgi:serine O-acetyltransferase